MKTVEHELKNDTPHRSSFISSNTQDKTDLILNDIMNKTASHYSHEYLASKSAEHFCATNLVAEHDFTSETQTISSSNELVSPLNIFATIKYESSLNVPLALQQVKALIKDQAKQEENSEKQQEKRSTGDKTGILLKISHTLINVLLL